MQRRQFLKMLALALPAIGVFAPAAADDRQVLKVGLLPDEDRLTVIWNNKSLAAYLEEELGVAVELVVPEDYDALIEAVASGEIEVGYFGPAAYTIARKRMAGGGVGLEPFAARVRDGATTYQSVVIAHAGSGLASIDDLRGSGVDFAYGDPASTSSHFAPKYTLMQAEVVPGRDYTGRHLGTHTAVAEAVAAGDVRAGALSRPIFERMIADGKVRAEAVTVLGYSEPLPQYPWAMRTDLDADLRMAMKAAFHGIALETPWGQAVLRPFGAEGFADMSDDDYDIIRRIRANVTG